MVSVQPFACPIFEEFGGLSYMSNVTFQTMLSSSTFIIRKNNYPAGFFLVLKVMEDSRACTSYGLSGIEPTDRDLDTQVAFLQKGFR